MLDFYKVTEKMECHKHSLITTTLTGIIFIIIILLLLLYIMSVRECEAL